VSRRRLEAAEAGHGEGAAGMERWLLTYSDMITLLLALFIVLFAVSTINQKKFEALALGLRETFNPNPGLLPSSNGLLQNASLVPTAGSQVASQTQPAPSSPAPPASSTAQASPGQQPLSTIAQQIQRALAAKGLSGLATETISTQGLVVQILSDKVFYAIDSASLGPVGDRVVDTIASVLRTDTNAVDVEGFTDDEPIIGGPYTTNTELSAMRAVNVVVRLYKVDGINHNRLAAMGFGSTHPVVPNTTPANMARNRRVDIVILGPGQQQP
jgi:chemotaxis protein MotB